MRRSIQDLGSRDAQAVVRALLHVASASLSADVERSCESGTVPDCYPGFGLGDETEVNFLTLFKPAEGLRRIGLEQPQVEGGASLRCHDADRLMALLEWEAP